MTVQDKIKTAKKSDWFSDVPKWQLKWWVFIGKLKTKIYRRFTR